MQKYSRDKMTISETDHLTIKFFERYNPSVYFVISRSIIDLNLYKCHLANLYVYIDIIVGVFKIDIELRSTSLISNSIIFTENI